MSDAESNDTFELDDKRAEIVPAIQKSHKGKFTFVLFFHKILNYIHLHRITVSAPTQYVHLCLRHPIEPSYFYFSCICLFDNLLN